MIKCEPHGFPADIWSYAICLMEMYDTKPPNRKARIQAMFITATEGLAGYVVEHEKYSNQFKEFLLLCLKMNPEERAKPEELLQVI